MSGRAAGMRVEALDLGRTFRSRAGRVAALAGVSLDVARGSFTALGGRSGSGKTTLLALLAGLLPPSSGRVELDGRDLAGLSRAGLDGLRRSIGLVFQHAPLLRRTPVWENVTCALVPWGVPPAERRDLARGQLERVELLGFEDRRPEGLSAGERQRVALARATVHAPRLLLADEPTSNLDAESAAIVCGVLAAERERGCTVLAASHDRDLIARADVTVRLADGRIV